MIENIENRIKVHREVTEFAYDYLILLKSIKMFELTSEEEKDLVSIKINLIKSAVRRFEISSYAFTKKSNIWRN